MNELGPVYTKGASYRARAEARQREYRARVLGVQHGSYLFHRVEERFDGRPTLMVLDEAWLFLRHQIFMRRLQGWLKTLRKKNVYVVFATQEIADAAESPITATILSACHTKIYLPDEEALICRAPVSKGSRPEIFWVTSWADGSPASFDAGEVARTALPSGPLSTFR
jgi:hypothetical protein